MLPVPASVAEPVLFGRSRFEEPAPAPAPALRRSPRRGPSHDSSATHSSLCGAALLGPENHQKRPPQPAWRKNSKRYSFPALQPGQIKKLFLKNVFFLLSRMECCSTFFKAYFFTRAGAGREKKPEPEPVKNGPAPQHWSLDHLISFTLLYIPSGERGALVPDSVTQIWIPLVLPISTENK